MYQYSSLFALQLVLNHYEEFKNNFSESFSKYFKSAKNKEELYEILSKYILEFKFKKEELKLAITIQEKRIDDIDKEKNKIDWQNYEEINQKAKH